MSELADNAPIYVLLVADLEVSRAFYSDIIGCSQVEHVASGDSVILRQRNTTIQLVALTSFNRPDRWLRPGATLHLDGGSPDELVARYEDLISHRVVRSEMIVQPWGDRSLRVIDPDGYAIEFWSHTERNETATLRLYKTAPQSLDAALAGLTLEHQRWRRAPAEWTIRAIVHHLADTASSILYRPRFGLAEPGRLVTGSSFDADSWAHKLMYDERDIDPSRLLFRATHDYITQLMTTLPEPWTRGTTAPDGRTLMMKTVLDMHVAHAYAHIAEIRAIRHVHGTWNDEG